MSTKAFTLSSIIPSISSVTKTAPSHSVSRRAHNAAATTGRSRMQVHNWVSVASALSVAAIVVGLGFYIYTINASVSKGYDFKREQAHLKELQDTQKRLVVQQAALGSIVKVNEVASTAGMVPVTNQEFLSTNQLSSR